MTPTSRHWLALCATGALALLLSASASARDISIPFDADNFPAFPAINDIDNSYFPLLAGATFTYRAEGPDGCEWDVFSVTGDTKTITIDGDKVKARVILDLAYEDADCGGIDSGELVEKTFDWHAQDNAGNVWYFGEETYHCEGADSCVLSDGSWEAGKDIAGTGANALPGIFMLDSPRKGDSYFQEIYPGFAEDQALVNGIGVKITLKGEDAYPPGNFSNCLVTKEWTTLEGGSVEQKSYCPNIGLVLVEEHHGKKLTFELQDPAASAESNDAFRFREVR
jgi:hypothetical protein